MIVAAVSFYNEKTFFEKMQSLEFMALILSSGSSLFYNKAIMCNGANLAYPRKVFYEVGGFSGIDDLASGDDELLLQKVAVKYQSRIGFLKLSEAVVYTHAKASIKEFLQQRRRWASKSTKYKDKKVVAFVMSIWFFNLSMVLNVLLGFYDVYFFKLFLIQALLKVTFEIGFLIPVTQFIKRPLLVFLMPLISPIHTLYMVYIGLMSGSKQYIWKGRLVK